MEHEAAQSPWLLMKESFRHRLVRPVNLTIPCQLLRLVDFGTGSWEIYAFLLDTPFLAVGGCDATCRSLINAVGCRTYKRKVVLSALNPRTT
jgi:hypothetical protein